MIWSRVVLPISELQCKWKLCALSFLLIFPRLLIISTLSNSTTLYNKAYSQFFNSKHSPEDPESTVKQVTEIAAKNLVHRVSICTVVHRNGKIAHVVVTYK